MHYMTTGKFVPFTLGQVDALPPPRIASRDLISQARNLLQCKGGNVSNLTRFFHLPQQDENLNFLFSHLPWNLYITPHSSIFQPRSMEQGTLLAVLQVDALRP